jgi:predicted  nucleic acid-binding Zn-ribbon protein
MTVTKQLLELFRVDQQLRGLRSRLDAAERFLQQQKSLQADLKARAAALESQARQLKAAAVNSEVEAKRLDEKIAHLREQMNSAKTAKEYNAFLNELGTFKDQKSAAEDEALAHLAKVEEISKELASTRAQLEEREKMVATAAADREAKAAEIKDRLDELTARRQSLAGAVPRDALATLERLIATKRDDAMAAVEVMDRRNYEYTCAGCFMTLPMETVNSIVAGRLTLCVNCGCILYTEEEIVRPKQPAKA